LDQKKLLNDYKENLPLNFQVVIKEKSLYWQNWDANSQLSDIARSLIGYIHTDCQNRFLNFETMGALIKILIKS